jgi:serine/threonine/tyrosine protein kinase RAD53
MELIDGKQLDEYVYSHGPCNGNLECLSKLFLEIIAKEIIRQILDGVKYIHEQGVCHRDIKPDNIMLLKEKESSDN